VPDCGYQQGNAAVVKAGDGILEVDGYAGGEAG
jgi:hypothetical protein